MAFYKKRIVRPDTAADIAERIKNRKACEQALADVRERYPVITAENFEEANAYRERRIREIEAA